MTDGVMKSKIEQCYHDIIIFLKIVLKGKYVIISTLHFVEFRSTIYLHSLRKIFKIQH